MNKEYHASQLYTFKDNADAKFIADSLLKTFPEYIEKDYILDKNRIIILNELVHKDIVSVFKTL